MLLATGLGSGLAPIAPGTVGSLLALPIWWFCSRICRCCSNSRSSSAVRAVSIWIGHRACRATGVGDASAFVLDEFVGQWMALLAAPKTLLWVACWASCCFVLFDIAKPWPVSWADRRIAGGLGVVRDDVLAGVLAAVVLQLSVALIAC